MVCIKDLLTTEIAKIHNETTSTLSNTIALTLKASRDNKISYTRNFVRDFLRKILFYI